jgi:hypothetical protein
MVVISQHAEYCTIIPRVFVSLPSLESLWPPCPF